MNFKKRVNGSWTDTSHYIHKTDTDTITTLPTVLYPTGTTATVGLKGQTVQSGTPTPDSPIMPQGTGERTGNLLNFNALKAAPSGRMPNSTYTFEHLLIINLEPNTAYTLSSTGTGNTGGTAADNRSLYINGTGDNEVVFVNHPITKTTGADGLLYVGFESSRPNAAQYLNGTAVITLNLGSTALPYEPYGIKIPISSASTTTPVYLGEVETTRKIKKLVLTGEESGWQLYQQSSPYWRYEVYQFWLDNIIDSIPYSSLYSTIAPFGATSQNRQNYEYGCYAVSSGKGIAFQMVGAKDTFPNVTAWKTYLQQQYAAGTPVCVWYVLAEPETGIVNEPLMKIGDYADTLSNVSIPVTAGGDALSVDTTVQPSEVTVNYKGWHPVADVHERTNGAWT